MDPLAGLKPVINPNPNPFTEKAFSRRVVNIAMAPLLTLLSLPSLMAIDRTAEKPALT